MSLFETAVSQLVKVELTNESVNTEWVNGSLFVSPITQEQAKQVETMLTNRSGFNCNLGRVQVTQIGSTPEFAYDFV